MSRLALYFLGPPLVLLDGESVDISRRKVLSLLIYLAVTAKRHSRDELAEWFYGKYDREHARANLRQTMSRLRRAIGKDRLDTDRLGVRLSRSDDMWIDTAEYKRLLESGKTADAKGDFSTAVTDLDRAVGLCRGEFLSGFYLKDSTDFEDWQMAVQESLRREQVSALQRLLEIHEMWGQYEKAINYGLRWISLEPLEEAVYRRLMVLYSVSGHRNEALRQYERCRAIMERELGEKPQEETEQLREQIDSGKFHANFLLHPEDQRGSPPHIRTKPFREIPLFMFVQIVDSLRESGTLHEKQILEAIAEQRGQFLTASGEALCAVLTNVDAAIRAALHAQIRARATDGEVRIVLFAGEQLGQDIPSSSLVERAEMLLDVLQAGQIALNEAAADLASSSKLPESTSLCDLGIHRFKDLSPAQPVHLLVHPSLPQGSGQLPTLDTCPNNLQTQPTPFIGRKRELAELQDILLLEDVRLLTLTGTGGVGKTRLALQVAAGLYKHFEHGIFFVDLATLRDPNRVVGHIVATLNIPEMRTDKRSQFGLLVDYLGGKRVLLLLDNFEHLLPAAPQIAELLVRCSRLKVIATSREALHLRSERVCRVPPLQLPSKGQRQEVIRRCEAVQMFADRAASALSTFKLSGKNIETVAEICMRLDGLPLAIELAATRIKVLTPQTLLRKLKNRLYMLKQGPGDLPKRQQTLRSEVDWSYELLKPEERRVFMRLAIFPGDFTLEAAEAVCNHAGEKTDVYSILSSLTEKSLLRQVESSGESRFRMLEIIREYALGRLEESGERDALEPRFAAYFSRLVERAEPELYASHQLLWFDRIEQEYVNIRTALTFMYERGEILKGLRLAGNLGWFWFRREHRVEGEYWLELFRAAAAETGPPGLRAKVAYFLGWLKLCVRSAFWGNPEGKHFFNESLELWRKAGNQRGVALSKAWLVWKDEIEDKESWAFADESVEIARDTGDPWTIAWCLKAAYSHLRRQDKDLAFKRSALEQAIRLARKIEDPFLLSQALKGMGNVFTWEGELEEAEPWYKESLRIAREIKDTWSVLDNMKCLGDGYLGLGQISKAKEVFAEGLQLSGTSSYLGWFIEGFCVAAMSEGRSKRALRLRAFSESKNNPNSRYDPQCAKEFGLDDKTATTEWRIGQYMTPEQAVSYAVTDR